MYIQQFTYHIKKQIFLASRCLFRIKAEDLIVKTAFSSKSLETLGFSA